MEQPQPKAREPVVVEAMKCVAAAVDRFKSWRDPPNPRECVGTPEDVTLVLALAFAHALGNRKNRAFVNCNFTNPALTASILAYVENELLSFRRTLTYSRQQEQEELLS